jgi:single-strand DNA-binding protein
MANLNLNKVIIGGRLTADPELKTTPGGLSVVSFVIAVTRKYTAANGERETDFPTCVAWRQTADFISKYFHKGDAITVEGSLRNNNYEDKSGVKHYSYVVMADNVGFGGSKQQPTQSGYNAQYAQQAPQQGQAYQQQAIPPQNAPQYAQRPPQQIPQANNAPTTGNLDQFVDILSEGELPF